MLPKKVNILSVDYDVKYCSVLSEVSGDEMELNWGKANHMTKEIRVYRHPSDIATLQTLLHEIVHCYEQALGMRLDEQVIDFIAAHTLDFIIRNKVDKWITVQK